MKGFFYYGGPNAKDITDFVTKHLLFPPQLKVDNIYLMLAICFVMNITYEIADHQLFFDKLKGRSYPQTSIKITTS